MWLIFTMCQTWYHSSLWYHRGIGQLRTLIPRTFLKHHHNEQSKQAQFGLNQKKKRNHLEEWLLDQAQVQASYTPLFGFIRSAYPKA